MIDQASGFDVRYLWAAGAISGVLLLAAWSAVARPRAFFGIAWLVVTGVPAWLLVPPSSSLFAERYLYLPSIGLAMTLPALVTDVVRRWLPARSRRGRHRTRRRTYRTILLLLSAGLGLTAFLQTRGRATDWGSEQTILDRSLERDSRNVAIAVNRGFLLRTSGHPAEALALYQQTITAVDTGTPFYRTEHDRTAWTRLLFEAGTLAAEAGRTDEAESDFRRAVESDPTHEGACASLGALLGNEGRFEEAVEVLAPGVAANPGSTLLRNNLAQALMLVGRTVEAREQLRAVLTIDPNDATARARLEQLGDAH
jgi:tetratricopeptide (TPR) repeat protein